MKPFVKYFLGFSFGFLSLTSCENQAEVLIPAVESSIFTKYVSVGGSLSAGFTNGGLYREGQLTSYPNLIALQTGAKFEQPLFSIGQENGSGYFFTKNTMAVTPTFEQTSDKTAIINASPLTFAKYNSTTTNNLGVAGLRMSDIAKNGLGNAKTAGFNPFYERILPAGKEDLSYAEFVKVSNPTFFTASIGDFDMLAFAISGGKTGLTETSVFAINTQKLLDALVANKSKGIITNLPNILDLPLLNFYTFQEIAKIAGITDIYITTGNGIVRVAMADDKILLNAIENVGKTNAAGQKKGFSAMFPLSTEEVLDKDETSAVSSRLSDFNEILKTEAEKRGIILFDLNNLYTQIKNKTYTTNNLKFESSVMTGGFFSLDGMNPSPRGSAVIANEIIKLINENFKNSLKTAIPTLDVSKFEALKVK